jgi:hypothetical protein
MYTQCGAKSKQTFSLPADTHHNEIFMDTNELVNSVV